jgi:hypothetical protein
MRFRKTSAEAVLGIRHDCAAGMPAAQSAARYGESLSQINKILNGTLYAHVGGPIRAKRDRLPAAATRSEVEAEGRRRIRARLTVGANGCWYRTGKGINAEGYAAMSFDGHDLAHRVSYTVFVGTIPAGFDVDHFCHSLDVTCNSGNACRHRRCVNPFHLIAVPHIVNIRAGRGWTVQGSKTHCKWGHEFSEANTLRVKAPRGGKGRKCRQCRREYPNRRRDAAKDAGGITGMSND